jgi:MarR family transcriptional regulator, organic hydroperoxide resistance regulator
MRPSIESTRLNSPPDSNSSPALRFFAAYWRMGKALGHYLDPLLERSYGLSLKDYSILAGIDRGILYPTELAERLDWSKDMVTRIINKLLAAGLIERKIDDEDSRRIRLELSAKGHEQRTAIRKTIETTIEPILENLGKNQTEQLTGLLETLQELIVTTLGDNTLGESHAELQHS